MAKDLPPLPYGRGSFEMPVLASRGMNTAGGTDKALKALSVWIGRSTSDTLVRPTATDKPAGLVNGALPETGTLEVQKASCDRPPTQTAGLSGRHRSRVRAGPMEPGPRRGWPR